MTDTLSPIAAKLAHIAWEAGNVILGHYGGAVATRQKDDHSPVTAADEDAEALILARLHADFPDIPVVAEEQTAAGTIIHAAPRFFLVDPLDGTKEFIKRNGEFTVNIAEIENGQPLRGVVYAPALGRMWVGDAGGGAYELAVHESAPPDLAAARRIAARDTPQAGMVAVASRSHRDTKTEEYLAAYPIADFKAAGSSLKFCLIASGEADIYPRHGTTMEWDTAAGHAVLAAAGGTMTCIDGKPFTYGKPGFANPHFVARGKR